MTELRNGRCTRWHVCLDLPYHLSYPCVFPCGGELWLVPECYQSGKIMLFRAVDFPLRWERAGAIADCIAADTTPLLRGAKRLEDIRFFTTVFRSARERNNDNLSLLPAFGESPVPVLHSLSTRCAGHFIARGGEILRPVQDCSKIYGGSLLFARVSPGEVYAEQVFLRVLPPDSPAKDGELAVTLERGAHRTYAGIHTYNESDAYEVIDLLIPAHKTLRALLVRLVRRLFFPHSS